MPGTLLFVYGTLKRGFYNHHVIAQAGGEYISDAYTAKIYDMASLGAYPAMLEGGTFSILGELYQIEDIAPVDLLEGHPDYYSRKYMYVITPLLDGVMALGYYLEDWDRPMEQDGITLIGETKTWTGDRA